MKSKLPRPWQRSTKRRPCAVCHGAGCLYTGPCKSPIAVVCAKVESNRQIGTSGYLHVLRNDGPLWAPWRTSLGRLEKQQQAER
jgi:hypothetical protein